MRYFQLVLALAVLAAPIAEAAPNPSQDLEVKLLFYRPGCDTEDYHFIVRNLSAVYDYQVDRRGDSATYNGPEVCWDGFTECTRSYTNESDRDVLATKCITGSPLPAPGFPQCALPSCAPCDEPSECPCDLPVGCDNPCTGNPPYPPDCTNICGDPLQCPCPPVQDCANPCEPPPRCDNPPFQCTQPVPGCQCPPFPEPCFCAWCATINEVELWATAYRDACTGSSCNSWIRFVPEEEVICKGVNLLGLPELPGARPPFCPFESVCVNGITDPGCTP